MRNPKPEPARAFTLIELLAVVAIIALLMGIFMPALGRIRGQARKTKTSAMVAALEKACEAFNADNGHYPRSAGENPFEGRGSGVQLSGAQWLGLQLLGANQMGYVKPVRSNDSNADGIIDEDDWDDWYSGEPSREYARLGPYATADPDVVTWIVDRDGRRGYKARHPDPPSELEEGSSFWSNGQVPFFVDPYDYPVLYYRANAGAKYPVTTGSGSDVAPGVYSQADNAQFTGGQAEFEGRPQRGYDFAGLGMPHPMRELGYSRGAGSVPPETFTFAIHNRNIFEATKRGNSGRIWPHNDKTFLIISAGADGLFGTGDDIANFNTGR